MKSFVFTMLLAPGLSGRVSLDVGGKRGSEVCQTRNFQ